MALHSQRSRPTTQWRWSWLACAAAFGGGALMGIITPAGDGAAQAGAGSAASMPSQTNAVVSLRVDSELPSWLAPGAKMTVTGWAEANTRVSLVVGGRRVATTTSGGLGRFVLTGRVAAAGRRPSR